MTWSSVAASGTVSDTFTRADGALGSNWSAIKNTPTISSNAVVAGSTAGFSVTARIGESYNVDHGSQLALNDVAANSVDVWACLRAGSLGPTGYLLATNPSTGDWSLLAYVNNSAVVGFDRSGTTSFAVGDTVKIAVSGATVTAYRNGSALTARSTVPTLVGTTGLPGFGFFKQAGTQTADNWVGTGALQDWDALSDTTDPSWDARSIPTRMAWAQLSTTTDSGGGVDFVLRLTTEFPLYLGYGGLPLYTTIEEP